MCNERQQGDGGGTGVVCKPGLKSGSQQLAHLSGGEQRVMLLILSHVRSRRSGCHSQSMRVDLGCAKPVPSRRQCRMLHLHCAGYTHVAVKSCTVATSLCTEEAKFQNGKPSLLQCTASSEQKSARTHAHVRTHTT